MLLKFRASKLLGEDVSGAAHATPINVHSHTIAEPGHCLESYRPMEKHPLQNLRQITCKHP